uniref:Uncharacterized protein n=1 Tax=Chromera velia CCMP2878 TaxID=1169474 RepID=A0A0G4HS12_9ALVE|eukprot:Cvel_8183.t1-p1 / transcript=Cvel_8183.t1 / gene=Cvel_8183 / organism=Chromera_velia_CCMP2878 / gene_product=hypothetical protein / transcript_product=hypothetical protein / location=Cvel_scaffold446:14021-14721(-) / protein_length=147 / sequence_SO=supercontig / SO=protein_coding / is_pseudo=false
MPESQVAQILGTDFNSRRNEFASVTARASEINSLWYASFSNKYDRTTPNPEYSPHLAQIREGSPAVARFARVGEGIEDGEGKKWRKGWCGNSTDKRDPQSWPNYDRGGRIVGEGGSGDGGKRWSAYDQRWWPWSCDWAGIGGECRPG